MAWSTPLTAVSNATLTAAQWNASVRDNLLETAPAKATTAGRIFVAAGTNSIVERAISESVVDANESTTSATYTDLTTSGPAVTVTTGTKAIWIVTGRVLNATAGESGFASVTISGASSVAAADGRSLEHQVTGAQQLMRASAVHLETGLTAGSNTFTMKYRASAGTAFFRYRRLLVIAL